MISVINHTVIFSKYGVITTCIMLILVCRDSLTSHFLCLKTEILNSKDYKTIASLIVELSQAATKYYILKRLFWQDSELIEYCIYQMNTIKETIFNNLDCIE